MVCCIGRTPASPKTGVIWHLPLWSKIFLFPCFDQLPYGRAWWVAHHICICKSTQSFSSDYVMGSRGEVSIPICESLLVRVADDNPRLCVHACVFLWREVLLWDVFPLKFAFYHRAIMDNLFSVDDGLCYRGLELIIHLKLWVFFFYKLLNFSQSERLTRHRIEQMEKMWIYVNAKEPAYSLRDPLKMTVCLEWSPSRKDLHQWVSGAVCFPWCLPRSNRAHKSSVLLLLWLVLQKVSLKRRCIPTVLLLLKPLFLNIDIDYEFV